MPTGAQAPGAKAAAKAVSGADHLPPAATYDSRELARMRPVSVQPNVAEARKWCMRAVELGAPDHKLATLGGN